MASRPVKVAPRDQSRYRGRTRVFLPGDARLRRKMHVQIGKRLYRRETGLIPEKWLYRHERDSTGGNHIEVLMNFRSERVVRKFGYQAVQ